MSNEELIAFQNGMLIGLQKQGGISSSKSLGAQRDISFLKEINPILVEKIMSEPLSCMKRKQLSGIGGTLQYSDSDNYNTYVYDLIDSIYTTYMIKFSTGNTSSYTLRCGTYHTIPTSSSETSPVIKSYTTSVSDGYTKYITNCEFERYLVVNYNSACNLTLYGIY